MKSLETELFELQEAISEILKEHDHDSAAVQCLLRRWAVCMKEQIETLLSEGCEDRNAQLLKLFKSMEAGRHE